MPHPVTRWLASMRLRPYGDSLATPAVRVWLGFAWIVILLMASIEGAVWGLVGASIVPQAAPGLRPLAGGLLFVLMFATIWIVDASLILSERPTLRPRGRRAPPVTGPPPDTGALARWLLGLAVRVGIVAISLYVTAPLLGKLIRADDIETYHQRQVEQYFAQREAALQVRIRERAERLERDYQGLLGPLESRIADNTRVLTDERERRARVEAEYAPELEVLRNDLAASRGRMGDEVLGRHERPAGYGPEARKWDARARELEALLAAREAELAARLGTVGQAIADLERRLNQDRDEFQRLSLERQARLDRIAAELAAEQPAAEPPRLTFAARALALRALRDSPDERGVPHFETVDGFAQAALGVLFFSLLALKLFEPLAVRNYFNESLQYQYQRYCRGGLDELPGFPDGADAARRLDPVEFARRWNHYEYDPAGFHANQQALCEARAPIERRRAEQTFEDGMRRRRALSLDEELAFARQRRELELAAYARELALRLARLGQDLDEEQRRLVIQREHDGQRRVAAQERLARLREELNLLHGLETSQQAECAALRATAAELERRGAAAPEDTAARARQLSHDAQLREAESRLAATGARIQWLEDGIARLLDGQGLAPDSASL